jgi:2'-5' RNA ligase
MILKTFTSIKSPAEAIEKANKEIHEMHLERYEAKEIAQSESTYYNSFSEEEQFHFTLTILFEKEDLP